MVLCFQLGDVLDIKPLQVTDLSEGVKWANISTAVVDDEPAYSPRCPEFTEAHAP
jgi:hypothetical protein